MDICYLMTYEDDWYVLYNIDDEPIFDDLYVFIIHDRSYCLWDFDDNMIMLTLLYDRDDWMMIQWLWVSSSVFVIRDDGIPLIASTIWRCNSLSLTWSFMLYMCCIYVVLCLVVDAGLQVPDIDSTWSYRSKCVFIPMVSCWR